MRNPKLQAAIAFRRRMIARELRRIVVRYSCTEISAVMVSCDYSAVHLVTTVGKEPTR